MSDITKCKGEDCPIKNSCFRFTAPIEPLYQSFFVEIPGEWIDMSDLDIDPSLTWKCEMFWPINACVDMYKTDDCKK